MADNSLEELEAAWKARCASGNFSQGVLGVGQIKVMGRSGDATLQFPRITSLDVLSTLAPDEQYAVQAAQAIVTEARNQQRVVFAVSPTQPPVPQTEFQPDAESLMVVARVAGG